MTVGKDVSALFADVVNCIQPKPELSDGLPAEPSLHDAFFKCATSQCDCKPSKNMYWIRCPGATVRTDNIELKKLVYLYVMNYAKASFVTD